MHDRDLGIYKADRSLMKLAIEKVGPWPLRFMSLVVLVIFGQSVYMGHVLGKTGTRRARLSHWRRHFGTARNQGFGQSRD